MVRKWLSTYLDHVLGDIVFPIAQEGGVLVPASAQEVQGIGDDDNHLLECAGPDAMVHCLLEVETLVGTAGVTPQGIGEVGKQIKHGIALGAAGVGRGQIDGDLLLVRNAVAVLRERRSVHFREISCPWREEQVSNKQEKEGESGE